MNQLGRIISISSTGTEASINIFRPPLPEERVDHSTHSYLEDTIEVLQTTTTVVVSHDCIVEVSFVIPYTTILNEENVLEISGMELVRVLRGRIRMDGQLEEVFTPSFPCK